jgi:hypothetical protein
MATTKLEQRACVLRRVLEAVTNTESVSSGRPGIRPMDRRVEVRSFLIRSTQNVIHHYRRVLSIHQKSNIDKSAILVRLEEQERELRDLMRRDEERSMTAHAHFEAA